MSKPSIYDEMRTPISALASQMSDPAKQGHYMLTGEMREFGKDLVSKAPVLLTQLNKSAPRNVKGTVDYGDLRKDVLNMDEMLATPHPDSLHWQNTFATRLHAASHALIRLGVR